MSLLSASTSLICDCVFFNICFLNKCDIWLWPIVRWTAVNSCSVSEWQRRLEDTKGSRIHAHLLIDLNELRMCVYACWTCRQWAERLWNILLICLLRKRHLATKRSMLRGALTAYPWDNVSEYEVKHRLCSTHEVPWDTSPERMSCDGTCFPFSSEDNVIMKLCSQVNRSWCSMFSQRAAH